MSTRLENAMLLGEKREKARAERAATIRWAALLAVMVGALVASHIVAALVGTHFGYEAGFAAGVAKRDETPRAAFSCKQAMALCRSELHKSLKD